MIYDLIIIGGGPAGAAAAVYAGRKKLKTLLIAELIGGQSVVSDDIQNWIGHKSISGAELAMSLETHVRAQETVELKIGTRVEKLETESGGFSVTMTNGERATGRAVLIASGSRRRHLNIPGEAEFEGKGVMYCATCDAPMFGGKTVVVVGGGNAGLEAAQDLTHYAEKIYLFIRGDKLRGDPVTQERVLASPKITILYNSEIKEIHGERFVSGVKYLDKAANAEKELKLDGVFVEIGSEPNASFAKELVTINEAGEIVVDHRTGGASVPGIFAAGDVTDGKYKQNNIAVGDAIKAALSAHDYVCKCATE
ncbi:MAG: FAD-dependent oxidoreductase [Candidatus Niyogibacteria bacterium]|nr:FAD-dependent oxidoreductase [Candidatus Niyogibacteria bacterium]